MLNNTNIMLVMGGVVGAALLGNAAVLGVKEAIVIAKRSHITRRTVKGGEGFKIKRVDACAMMHLEDQLMNASRVINITDKETINKHIQDLLQSEYLLKLARNEAKKECNAERVKKLWVLGEKLRVLRVFLQEK